MIFNFLFNTLIFFGIMNFNWLLARGWRNQNALDIAQRVLWPAVMALALTLLDNVRIWVFQLAIFGLLVYQFYRFRRK